MGLGVVDRNQAAMLADSIRRFQFAFDDYTDPLLYPSKDADKLASSNFFFFMVAIDHRTHSRGREFRGKVGGVDLVGAELLWALAKRQFASNPRFFSPEHLSKVTAKEIQAIFCANGVVVSGLKDRTQLLRDCAQKLQRDYDGSTLRLIHVSGGYLVRRSGGGLLQLLKRFDAYSDPLRKKSFLLTKFLERRGYFQARDPHNLHVPVDNVVQRLALRTGVLRLRDEGLEGKIRTGTRVTAAEDEALRRLTSRAFDRVAATVQISATRLDDILWEFGRVHCRVPIPNCDSLPEDSRRRPYRMVIAGPVGECPFGPGCKGYNRPEIWALREPNFKTTFY